MLDSLNTILSWLCLYVLLWNAYILIFNRGVPNIRTARSCRKKICEFLQDQFLNKENITIADLGSGNGHFTRDIARALPHAQIQGYEISRLSILKSKLLQKLTRLGNIKYYDQDFFKANLLHLDALVFFLSAYEMSRISDKIKNDLKPGTIVISNRFALKDIEPDKVINVSTLAPKQGRIYIYKT